MCDAALEITPTHSACEKEEHGGNIASRDFSDLIEDQCEHETGEQWLQHIPERSKDGLLVAGDEVAMNETINKVAVFP